MNEDARDVFTNENIEKATLMVNEAGSLLKSSKLKEALDMDYQAIFCSMRALLAIDDFFSEDDFAVEKNFRSMYIDNGMTSEELETTLDRILEYYDNIKTVSGFQIRKPDIGYFTSKAHFFIEEISDNIIQRRNIYSGQ